MPRPDRHAVLADPTRRALLGVLTEAGGPLGVRELAALVGIHVNSAREQLHRLERAGMVRSRVAAPVGRGRPVHLFELRPDPDAEPFRALAGALASEVAQLPGAAAVATAAGERWGHAAVRAPGDAATDEGHLERLAGILDDAGFAPDAPAPGAMEIRLRACPFLPLEGHQLAVVCGVHLGFVRGALRTLGSDRDAVSIEPFVQPDLCVARLSAPRTP
ncbi:MAG TPA: helix-turn-helix domain-containing protein [Candidatus Limnocylindrales bacterium]|nr:helix-turn-helix domain-containing protein [Candidatus Limnocylindrales bacterium]